MSQRAYPTMALIQPEFSYGIDGSVSFILKAPGMEEIRVEVPSDGVEPTHVIRYV